MKTRGLVRLAIQNLRADTKGAVINGLATCVGVAALAFFVAFGLGVGAAARRIFPGEARLVEVVPSGVSLGAILGGGQLDDAAAARLRAIPGVAEIYRKLNVRVPIAASQPPTGLPINWPTGFVVQIPAVGVDPGFVAGDVSAGQFVDHGPDGAVPVLLSNRLLEFYDKTIAPSWNLRRLPPGGLLVGLELPVQIGFSIVPQKTEDRIYWGRLKLIGLSDRVPLYQLALPLETARRLHKEYNKTDPGYSSIALLASRPDDVPAIAAAVRRMGFSIDEGDRAIAERIGTAVNVTSGALALLALIMCALAGLAIAQSLSASVRARAREIAILLAVGATRANVRTLVLTEAGLVGAAGGAAGVLFARLVALGADRLAIHLLPDFPFRPDSFFHFAIWIYALGLGVGILSAVAGALGPARSAARLDPARAIS